MSLQLYDLPHLRVFACVGTPPINAMAKVSLLNSMCDMHVKKLKALFELAEAHAMGPDTLAAEWTTMQREMDKEEVMEADDSEEEDMEPPVAEEETREEVAADA